MRRLVPILLAAWFVLSGYARSDDQNPIAVVQRLLDAMSAHDADAAGALFIPGAVLWSIRADGLPVATPYENWLGHLRASKDAWLERIWKPTVLEHGSVAVVWADYDFHLNGKLTHCGIDSFDLLKTASGWKIAAISDTRETSGCEASPLGRPGR